MVQATPGWATVDTSRQFSLCTANEQHSACPTLPHTDYLHHQVLFSTYTHSSIRCIELHLSHSIPETSNYWTTIYRSIFCKYAYFLHVSNYRESKPRLFRMNSHVIVPLILLYILIWAWEIDCSHRTDMIRFTYCHLYGYSKFIIWTEQINNNDDDNNSYNQSSCVNIDIKKDSLNRPGLIRILLQHNIQLFIMVWLITTSDHIGPHWPKMAPHRTLLA